MLLLECTPDEALARKLGRTRKECRHHNDKGRVCRALQKGRAWIGMIDEDPLSAQPGYLRTLEAVSLDHDIRVLEDKSRDHRIVILCPRLEEWLIKTAKSSGLQMSDFGLSDRARELHREITSRLPKLDELITALLQAGSARLARLQALICGGGP